MDHKLILTNDDFKSSSYVIAKSFGKSSNAIIYTRWYWYCIYGSDDSFYYFDVQSTKDYW